MTSETFNGGDDSFGSSGPAAALEQLERAELLTHTRYPKLGPWYPPLAGALVATYIASIAAPSPIDIIGMAATVVVLVVLVSGYTRRRGAFPDFRKAPTEIKRVIGRYFVAMAVFVGGAMLLWAVTTWWITALAAGVVAAGGVALYERRYAEAAAQAEARITATDVHATQ